MCDSPRIFLKAVPIMSDVQQFPPLQRSRSRWAFSLPLRKACPHQTLHLRRYIPRMACSLMLLSSFAAHAQCPIQFAYPPTPSQAQASAASDDSLQQDVRASIAAQKNGNCKSAKLFQKRTLSKEDLQELRRVVREHAKSKPLHSATSVIP